MIHAPAKTHFCYYGLVTGLHYQAAVQYVRTWRNIFFISSLPCSSFITMKRRRDDRSVDGRRVGWKDDTWMCVRGWMDVK